MKKKLNPNARKWVAALRSGKFKQAKGALGKVNEVNGAYSHCCLGVACELYQKAHKLERIATGGVITYDSEESCLPPPVQEWLGMRTEYGDFRDAAGNGLTLAELNDNGKRFSTIAKIIESQPEGLFAP